MMEMSEKPLMTGAAENAGKQRTLSVVIPALNEADSLPGLIDGIRANIPGGMTCEVIVVDDGSADDTAEVVRQIAAGDPAVHLISFRRNFGKAAALGAGFRHSSGDIIISMDGDLQDDPAEIPRFIEKLDEGFDLVSGWKKDRKDPLEKRLPSKLFNAVVSRMSGVRLHDHNCGFKAYRRCVAESIDLYGELHRYIPCLAAQYGFRIAEIPVRHSERRFGRSKYNGERYLHGMLDAVTVMFLMRFGQQPMYLFGRLGLISGLLGAGFCIYSAIRRVTGYPAGRLLLPGALLVLAGMLFFGLGLLGELFVRLGRRKDRDEACIREIL